MSKRQREKEEDTEDKTQKFHVPPTKKVPRVVEFPLIHEVKKLTWEELGLNPQKQSVIALKTGPASTREAFVLASSRFESFLALKRAKTNDFVYSEALLIEFFEEFLFVLSDKRGQCILDLGSFFPQISHVKKYISLKYGVDVGDMKDLTLLLKGATKTHEPKKAAVFTSQQILEWSKRPNQNPSDRQKTLIALCGMFSLARGSEVIVLTRKNLTFQENGVMVEFRRVKSPKNTKALIPVTDDVDSIALFKAHLQAIPKLRRKLQGFSS